MRYFVTLSLNSEYVSFCVAMFSSFNIRLYISVFFFKDQS